MFAQPKKALQWDIVLVWYGIFPALVILEIWGVYQLFEYLEWIEPIKDFLKIEKAYP